MNTLSFIWANEKPLAHELAMPFYKASLQIGRRPTSRPTSLTLWRADGSGIRIQSQMYDIAERVEVGVLEFDLISTPPNGEQFVELSGKFDDPITVMKLLLAESGYTMESGILLKTQNGSQLLAVAGVFPYTLAIQGVGDLPNIFRPEYPLKEYVIAPMP